MEGWAITFVKNDKVTKLREYTTIQNLQREMKIFKKDPKYRGGKLQLRTLEGLKHKAIL